MAYESTEPPVVSATDPVPPIEVEKLVIDDTHFLNVPTRLAKLIRLALSAQDKVDERAEQLEMIGMDIEESNRGFDAAVDLLRGINCHKTVLFARGEISRQELIALEYAEEEEGTGKRRQRPDTAGHPEVITLMTDNPDKVIISGQDVEAYLREHQAEGPFSVHVIRRREDGEPHHDGEDDVWRPAHSFLFLGVDNRGEARCFHKRGPHLRMRFELPTVQEILRPYKDTAAQFLVLPVNTPE